ncbi:MAG: hypothetical protein JHC93_02170 [Parachlamydiales bacterium]|nr:hypothetical protein [Parachlamydiales bacterium]
MHFIPHVCLTLLFAPIVTTPMIQPSDELIVQTYFHDVNEWKTHENWANIVEEGLKAISTCSQFELCNEEMRIRQQMSLAYYCLGDYTQALEMAQKSFELANSLDDNRGKVKSLYLTSYALRAYAGQESDQNKQRSLYKAAKVYAVNALVNCEGRQKEEEILKAKALYSLGAVEAEDKFEGNAQTAKTALKAAKHIYEKYAMQDYCQRTTIRLAKLSLQEGKIDKAQSYLSKVMPTVSRNRTRLQGEFLQAQIALAMGNRENATSIALHAQQVAQKLHAKVEEGRIQSLITHIDNEENDQH